MGPQAAEGKGGEDEERGGGLLVQRSALVMLPSFIYFCLWSTDRHLEWVMELL